MTSKTCTKCKETKPVSEFHKSRSTKDGLACRCKSCANAAKARYREENREKIRERDKAYYINNRDKRLANGAQRRKKNKEQENRRLIETCRSRNVRSLELAHRRGKPWVDWEDEFVMADNGLTNYQKAVKLGRSYNSVANRRCYLRSSARAELVHND